MEEHVMTLMSVTARVFVSTNSNRRALSAVQKRTSAITMTIATVPKALAVLIRLSVKVTLVLVHLREVIVIPLILVMAKVHAWIDFSTVPRYAGKRRMIAIAQKCVRVRVVNVQRIFFSHQELLAAMDCPITILAMHMILVMPMAIVRISFCPQRLLAETKPTLAM
jgi:hypothetical protein